MGPADVAHSVAGPGSFAHWLVILFGATAGLLTLVGLYGGVTRDVASRLREFAIRQALGATPGHVTTSLALRGFAATAAGAAIGAAVLLTTATRGPGQTPDFPGVEPASLGRRRAGDDDDLAGVRLSAGAPGGPRRAP